jgi:sterol 3beta-glucosyltransferase
MKLTILALGTRGDVQPHIALGLALQQRGYSVCIATAEAFRSLVVERGLEFSPTRLDPYALLTSEAGQRWLGSGGDPLRFIRTWREFTNAGQAAYAQTLRDAWKACQGANAIIYAGAFVAGHFIAQKLDVPEVWTLLHPLPHLPSREFPAIFAPELPVLGMPYNRATHTFFERLFWQALKDANERWRQDVLGQPPLSLLDYMGLIHRSDFPVLHGYSPLVGHIASDWRPGVHVTGYWFLGQPPGWQPSSALVDFLAAGAPPVYVGFGSMVTSDPQGELSAIITALQQTGQRGVLALGDDRGIDLPDDMFVVDGVPHDWLFQRVSMAIHHGGAGTTGASVRAGVPTVIVPYFLDQPYWGRRVFDLGVGPRPVPRRRLTAECLTVAIRTALGPGMKARAAELGQRIQTEDGIGQAMEIIEHHLSR